MIDTLIFDLDDTLLVNPIDQFLPVYVGALSKYLAGYAPPDRLVPQLMRASQLMVENRDPSRTNEQVFAAAFYPALGLDADALAPTLARFYEDVYPTLGGGTRPLAEARSLLDAAQARGYGLAIATNPLFPRRAIEHRLDWAGVGDVPWLYVTSYENMHFAKPHVEYYQEILDHIGRQARHCLMVGNEVKNDILPARTAGMRTFLVTTPDTPPPVGHEAADYHGTLTALRLLVETGGLTRE